MPASDMNENFYTLCFLKLNSLSSPANDFIAQYIDFIVQ